MCGIFISYGSISRKDLKYYLKKITLRGKDTFGISYINSENPKTFYYSYKNINFNECILSTESKNSLIIANSRLITNGSNEKNTQPLTNNELCMVHNGIVLDYTDFESNSIELEQTNKSDTAVLFEQISSLLNTKNFFSEIERYLNSLTGEINLVFYVKSTNQLFYYTNNGSLFLNKNNKNIILMSEKNFFLKKYRKHVNQINSNKLYNFSLKDDLKIYNSRNYKKIINNFNYNNNINDEIFKKVYDKVYSKLINIKRCNKCLIPRSYPKIKFDSDGICTFCNQNLSTKNNLNDLNLDDLKNIISNNSKKCLVGLSGGFDSCYALYFVKEILKLEPVAFTYDWGLTTDIARMNQSIMCQKLNVEHIIRTDNMSQKREYIKENIKAWFRRPHPGLIPLFMAGDKKFLHFERKLKKDLKINYSFFGNGSTREHRAFYWLYAGASLEGSVDNGDMSSLNLNTKLSLLAFYSINFLLNPKLLNKSLLNSALAYYYSFFEKYEYIQLYKYIKISDNEKNSFLINEFGLKVDKKYGQETWRMGDGQSAFNNLLYSVLCGFTEMDDQLSLSVRNSEIARDVAFERILNHNVPKKDMLQYFFDLVGLDSNIILKKIFELDSFKL